MARGFLIGDKMDIANIDEKQSLIKLQKFDPSSLARTSELGVNYNFEEVMPNANEIINLSQELDPKVVSNFPEVNQKEIEKCCAEILQYFNKINKFDNSTNNAIQVRNNLVSRSETLRDNFFNKLLKYKSMMPVNFEGNVDFKIYEKQIKNLTKHAQESAIELKGLLNSLTETYQTTENQYKKLSTNFETKIAEVNSKIEVTKTNISDVFDKQKNDLTDKFKNLKSELKESLALEEARTLWETKKNTHKKSYILIGILISIILIGLPALVICYIEELATKVASLSNVFSQQHVPTGQENSAWIFALSNQITRLLIIGLPITAYIWATRILVRIFLANKVLMDDAYERKTMLDTYLYLVGQGNANTEDRPLILNALFRSSPGQAPDIEPPNLSDVVNLKRKDG